MTPDPISWKWDPAILAADLREYDRLASDDWRRLYLNEFVAPEPIEVTHAQYEELSRMPSSAFVGERREWRTHRTGRTMFIGGRPVVAVASDGGDGSDGGGDDDGTPPAIRYRPAHGGRLPASVSIH